MQVKNFIHHTRPKGKRQIKQAIKDNERQIKYLKSIGRIKDNEITYYHSEVSYLKETLNRIVKGAS